MYRFASDEKVHVLLWLRCRDVHQGEIGDLWRTAVEYSPLAFADAGLEALYRLYRGWSMATDLPLSFLMGVLFWSVSLLRGASLPAPRVQHAFALAGLALLASSVGLLASMLAPAAYTAHWAGLHFFIHIMHLPIFSVARSILLDLYAGLGQNACASLLVCLHEYLLLFPHVGPGLVGALGVPLPFLLQIALQLAVLAISIPGNRALCRTEHVLSPLVREMPDPLAALQSSASELVTRVTNALAPALSLVGLSQVAESAFSPAFRMSCETKFAVWEVQIGVLALGIGVLQDAVWRWRVVKAVQMGTPLLASPDGTPQVPQVTGIDPAQLNGPVLKDLVMVFLGLLVLDGTLVALLVGADELGWL